MGIEGTLDGAIHGAFDGALAKVTYLPGVVPAPVVARKQPTDAFAERAVHRAENVSMNALTRKGRSRWELEQILLARELDEGVVEAELDRLAGVGLIDDAALAEDFVRTQHERKGLGRGALISLLRKKHIDPDVIENALEQLDHDDELSKARQLASRRASQLSGLDHATAVRRLSGYLQRKGYSADTVRQVVLEAIPRQASGVRFT